MAGGNGRRELVTLTRAEVVAIIREGAAAGARKGTEVTACPYKAGGSANDRVRVQAWLRGFLRARGTIG